MEEESFWHMAVQSGSQDAGTIAAFLQRQDPGGFSVYGEEITADCGLLSETVYVSLAEAVPWAEWTVDTFRGQAYLEASYENGFLYIRKLTGVWHADPDFWDSCRYLIWDPVTDQVETRLLQVCKAKKREIPSDPPENRKRSPGKEQKKTPVSGLRFALIPGIADFDNRDEIADCIEDGGGEVFEDLRENISFLVTDGELLPCMKKETLEKRGVACITKAFFLEHYVAPLLK